MLVPPLGSVLRLTQDWSFTLKNEHRNSQLLEHFKLYEDMSAEMSGGRIHTWKAHKTGVVTLPAGTILKLDRIYIRKGVGDYDSLTFYIKARHKGDLAARFFASLSECNKMEYEWVT